MSHFDLARLNSLAVKNRASEARGLKNGKTKKGRKLVPPYQLEAVEIQNSNSKDIHAIDDSQRSTRFSFYLFIYKHSSTH
jgi:hypothetical protein